MRILVIASTFPRWTGDTVPPFVLHLSEGLAAAGHEIHVLAPHAPGAAREERIGSMRVHRFRYAPAVLERLSYDGGILENLRQRPVRWLLVPGFLVAEFAALLAIVRRNRIDLIHAHWFLPQGLVAAVARTVVSRPLVMSAHGSDVLAMRSGIRRRMLQFAARRADACTTVTNFLRSELYSATGVEAQVIPMGVDLETFASGDATAGRIHAKPPRRSILFVGRLVPQKGVRHLLEAMVRVREEIPTSRLVIVGDGPDRPALERRAAELGLGECVDFAGPLPHSEVTGRYREADVLVLPSVQNRQGQAEGLPVVLLEAGAAGLPVVASAIGGVPDLVNDGTTGLLVNPGESDEIATAVTDLLRDDALYTVVAGGLRDAVIARYSRESVVGQFDALFRSLVPGGPP